MPARPRQDEGVAGGSADFGLTLDELRAVARFAAESARAVLPLYEEAVPGDGRPGAAVDAALVFADGAPRTNRQRLAATAAHRSAAVAPDEASRLAAGAAGDAAAAAYLHPLSRASQVGHILRAAARAAHAAELHAGGRDGVAESLVEQAAQRAGPVVIDVLRRYPSAAAGRNRTAQLMASLDAALRGSA